MTPWRKLEHQGRQMRLEARIKADPRQVWAGFPSMTPVTVWVLARSDDEGLPVLKEADPGARFVVGSGEADFRGAPEADAIFVCSTRADLLEPVLARAPGVRWIHSRAAGVDALLFPALAESTLPLTNGRGVFSKALAEFVVAALLFFAKDLRRMLRSQQAGVWDPFDVDRVEGHTLGIVGYGDIGRGVAGHLRAFGLEVLALRRQGSSADPLVDEFLPPEARGELMRRSDYVVVALPLTPQTRGLVGAAELAAMKETAVLINVGRGPIVDEAALLRVLERRRIRGAALDVFETEPLPAGHPFYRLDNVLLSPHCADHTPGWLDDAMRSFLANLRRFRSGEPLQNLVDKRRGY